MTDPGTFAMVTEEEAGAKQEQVPDEEAADAGA